MRNHVVTLGVILFLVFGLVSEGQSQLLVQDIKQQRRAQTGMKFLEVSINPRVSALGESATAIQVGSSALQYNPAGMARLDNRVEATFGQVQWIGDISYNAGTMAFRPGQGQYGIVGVTLRSVSYPEFRGTIRADNDQGYVNTGTFSPSAISAGVGYARSLTDRFSVGGHLKYAHQSLGNVIQRRDDAGNFVRQERSLGTVAFDFGAIYQTGFRSLKFGFSFRNFAQEVTYAQESFELPLEFRTGLSMDLVDVLPVSNDLHSALAVVEARRPRDFSEQIKGGLEYTFMDAVSLRGGYVWPHEERGINLGAGVHADIGGAEANLDYAYSEFGPLGTVNRLGLRIGF